MSGHPGFRLRVGVGLFVFSWLPIAQVYVWIGDLHGDAASEARLVIWTIQWTIGIIGLIIAGAASKAVVKRVGWRGLPKALWSMLRTGSVPDSAQPITTP